MSIGHGTGKKGRRLLEKRKRDIIYSDREKTSDYQWMRRASREGSRSVKMLLGMSGVADTLVHIVLGSPTRTNKY